MGVHSSWDSLSVFPTSQTHPQVKRPTERLNKSIPFNDKMSPSVFLPFFTTILFTWNASFMFKLELHRCSDELKVSYKSEFNIH